MSEAKENLRNKPKNSDSRRLVKNRIIFVIRNRGTFPKSTASFLAFFFFGSFLPFGGGESDGVKQCFSTLLYKFLFIILSSSFRASCRPSFC